MASTSVIPTKQGPEIGAASTELPRRCAEEIRPAQHHVIQRAERVVRQKAVLDELKRRGDPTDQARVVLAEMQMMQIDAEADLAQMKSLSDRHWLPITRS